MSMTRTRTGRLRRWLDHRTRWARLRIRRYGATIGAVGLTLGIIGRIGDIQTITSLPVPPDLVVGALGAVVLAYVWIDRGRRIRLLEDRTRAYRRSVGRRIESTGAEARRAGEERVQALQAEVELLRTPGRITRVFVALWDEGAEIERNLYIGLPYSNEKLNAAITAYESWWNRCAAFTHEYRPQLDLRLREAQLFPHIPTLRGNERFVGVGDQWFDVEMPREFRIRTEQVRAILREAIDAG